MELPLSEQIVETKSTPNRDRVSVIIKGRQLKSLSTDTWEAGVAKIIIANSKISLSIPARESQWFSMSSSTLMESKNLFQIFHYW